MVAMAAAGWRIYRPEESTSAKLFGGFAGGVLAGVLAILLKAEGAPALLGWSAVGILLAATALLAARNANFAPGEVLEESHLLILALAFASAVIPALADGWRSAGALNAAAEAAAATLPAWVFLATTLFVFFGGLWSLWRHR
jgi:hypothetical protein